MLASSHPRVEQQARQRDPTRWPRDRRSARRRRRRHAGRVRPAAHRAARLLEGLALAHGDGRYAPMLNNLAKTKLLILDDFDLAPLTVVVSQLPVERWHEMLEHPPSPMRS